MENNMPLEIALDNSKSELIEFINDLCNKYNLSFYLLEIVIKDIYNEIIIKKDAEIRELRKNYENRLVQQSEMKKEGEDDGNI